MEPGIAPKCAPLTGPSRRVEGWVLRRGLLEEAVLLAVMGYRDARGKVPAFQVGAWYSEQPGSVRVGQ